MVPIFVCASHSLIDTKTSHASSLIFLHTNYINHNPQLNIMSTYYEVCRRDGWAMEQERFNELRAGGHFLENTTIMDILEAQKPPAGDFPQRQTMDAAFLNSFVNVYWQAAYEATDVHDEDGYIAEVGYQAAAAFAKSSPMGQCQDPKVLWALPYNVNDEHWFTVIISRHTRTWTVLDSIPQSDYPDLEGKIMALVEMIPVSGEPDEPWEYVESWCPRQTDGWSCGIHTCENILHFLNGRGFSEYRTVDIAACTERYIKAFVEQGHPHALTSLAGKSEETSTAEVSTDTASTNAPDESKPVETTPAGTPRAQQATVEEVPDEDLTPHPIDTKPNGESTDVPLPGKLARKTRVLTALVSAKSKVAAKAKTEVRPDTPPSPSSTTEDSDTPEKKDNSEEKELMDWSKDSVLKPPPGGERFIHPLAFNRVNPKTRKPLQPKPELQPEIAELNLPMNDPRNVQGITLGSSTHEKLTTHVNVACPFSDSPARRRYQPTFPPPL